MNAHDNPIYRATLAAMQAADEIGGVADTAEYVALLGEIATTCLERIETAKENYYASGATEPLPCDEAAWQRVLDILYDNAGALLYWQMPEELQTLAERMHEAGAIGFDVDTDCYLHPDAVRNPDGDGYYIPHQFTR